MDTDDALSVRDLYDTPSDLVRKKVLSRLDAHCRHFIRLSPFLVIASSDETGAAATPRGDAPGFVVVQDDGHETLRVNGTGAIVADRKLLEPMAAQGKIPASALLVQVHEAFFHCGKAMIRSRLWQADAQIERSSFPSLGRIVADQIAGVDADAAEKNLEEAYRTRLY